MGMDCNFRGLARLAVVAAFLCLAPVAGIAEGVESLFEADVPVTGQQPELRTGYMRTAMEEVLVRVTGQRDVLDRASIRAMLADPERYVQQYRYFTQPDATPPRLMLRVRFDGGAIQQALQQRAAAAAGADHEHDAGHPSPPTPGLVTSTSSMIRYSRSQPKNMSSASLGEHTIGSPRRFSDVFSSTALPVRSAIASSSAW